MRLAVTVGFDADLVVRAVANIKADRYILLRGVTGTEGDEKSAASARQLIKALGRGEEHPIDLRHLPTGLKQLAAVQFDAVALAGGPRALVLLAFVAAVMKKARIYLVPEYSNDAVDITGLAAVAHIQTLTEPKLKILAQMADGPVDAESVAQAACLDTSTAYRHLSALEERGLVQTDKKRGKKYRADPLVAALAAISTQLHSTDSRVGVEICGDARQKTS